MLCYAMLCSPIFNVMLSVKLMIQVILYYKKRIHFYTKGLLINLDILPDDHKTDDTFDLYLE